MSYQPVMSATEVSEFIAEVFPQMDRYGLTVTELSSGKIVISMKVSDEDLRPGGTVSGPTMFTLADCASYVLILAHIGKVALAVTTKSQY